MALHRLTTIGEACRAMLRENLPQTLAWAIQQVTERERPFGHVIAPIGPSLTLQNLSWESESPVVWMGPVLSAIWFPWSLT